MVKIKIISNPFNKEMIYQIYKVQSDDWEDIKIGNPDSKLRDDETGRAFLPFKIKEIINIIIEEYYVNGQKIEIFFEGTQDEYIELEAVCKNKNVKDKVLLLRTSVILENARVIFNSIKDIFETVQPIIEKIIKDDLNVQSELNKVSDALKDIIPICVFGNYSTGKSTFINALIGSEILPSGGDPVTAKVYKIERSKNDDIARIRFRYKHESFELLFEGNNYRILRGNPENSLIRDIIFRMSETDSPTMSNYVNGALEIINEYERKNKLVISNVIEVEIPFSKKGVLGQSYNNFVIFDTPGSNSESNIEHSQVLEEALAGFSNGIPVWVSTYETLDSTDNASLCEKILNIKALDKRFTMIILNKADGSDLDVEGFLRKKEQEILEYNSVEKMYASGIYFVSSIMAIGSKNNGILSDRHYRRTYRSQKEMYSNKEDKDYITLYRFNIMPEQIKENIIEHSNNCDNLVYANSGMYCIEHEIEEFASKYASYNKCKMVYMFLKSVVEETNQKIIIRTESLKRTREARRRELEQEKSQLLSNLDNIAQTAEFEYDKESKMYVKSYVTSNFDYSYSVKDLEKRTDEIKRGNVEEANFLYQQKDYEDLKNNMIMNLKSNSQRLLKDGVVNSIKFIRDDLTRDYSILRINKAEIDKTGKEIDKETSDELLRIVVDEYKQNILVAKGILNSLIKEHWQEDAGVLRNDLIEVITGSDALSATQREKLSSIILNYQLLEFNDDADSVFTKSKFLRGNVLGIKVSNSEKLNIKRLTVRYNDRIKKTITEMALNINESCSMSFKYWKTNLFTVIEENITEYNPKLRDMSDIIKEETEKIADLENSQHTICVSLNQIKELMSWKEVD